MFTAERLYSIGICSIVHDFQFLCPSAVFQTVEKQVDFNGEEKANCFSVEADKNNYAFIE